MTTILILISLIIFFLILFELAHISVFGSPNSSISFNLDDYSFFDIERDMMFSSQIGGSYLSKRGETLLFKWHTKSHTIPRWSKFHKEIEAKYQQLLNQ